MSDHAGPETNRVRQAPIARAAHAKLNLTLAVDGRRPDGFHDLRSVMVPLSIADHLEVALAPEDVLATCRCGTDTLELLGDPAFAASTGPRDQNLVLRAVASLRDALGADGEALPPLAFRLEKGIPVAAGLAGGSSDAAAAIDAALDAWRIELPVSGRAAVGARVGSDVPFFFARGWAIVEGRGERVDPIPAPGPLAVLVVTPGMAVPTADVFRALAARRADAAEAGIAGTAHTLAGEVTDRLLVALRSGAASAALLGMAPELADANDLASAAESLVPELAAFRAGLAGLLGRPAGQSGSGPTCWVLYASLDEARSAADRVRAATGDGRLTPPGSRPPFIAAAEVLATADELPQRAGE